MYWLRTSNNLSPLLFMLVAGMFSSGGFLLVSGSFKIRKFEAPLLGFGVGLTVYLWMANIAGHFLSPDLAFTLPAPIILISGIIWRSTRGKPFNESPCWRTILIQAGSMLALIVFFTMIGRGLAIFDERKNLTLISLMANGDIPPHNPLNPTTLYQYHYGSQLLGASLVKTGGFFPWSAFDISKAVYWALCILLVYCLTRRFSSKSWAPILLSGAYVFMSGSRFLLMLLPEQFLSSLDASITFLGSSQDIGLPFSKAIFADWVIGGGPPSAYSYGFINGILKPLIMSHSGTETFALAIVLMIFLLVTSQPEKEGKWLVGILFAQLALTWETTYLLLAVTVLLLGIHALVKKTYQENHVLKTLVVASIISIPIVLLQGGTVTEMARNILHEIFSDSTTVNAHITEGGLFLFNRSPVIFSGHLGALSIFNPSQLVVGLCELGPIILTIPAIWKWLKNHTEKASQTAGIALFISALVGLLIPVFFTYPSSARDITRFSGYGLSILLLLFLLFILDQWKSQKLGVKIIESFSLLTMAVGGLVVGAEQLSALGQPILAEGIDGWDARISAQIWGKLEPDALVYDASSMSWRSAVISGNPTLLESNTYTQTDFEQLRDEPTLQKFQSYGFEYIYIDETWWDTLDQDERALFEQSCVMEIAAIENDQKKVMRSLINISSCP